MRILLMASAFNSVTQPVHVELADRGHELAVELALADEVMQKRSDAAIRIWSLAARLRAHRDFRALRRNGVFRTGQALQHIADPRRSELGDLHAIAVAAGPVDSRAYSAGRYARKPIVDAFASIHCPYFISVARHRDAYASL